MKIPLRRNGGRHSGCVDGTVSGVDRRVDSCYDMANICSESAGSFFGVCGG